MGRVRGKGDEHACRINYLFQAGQTVAKDAPELSQYYGQVLTVITEKTVPKKDFTMKRSMCKKCHAVLKVGNNATYRVRKNKHKKGNPTMVISCMLCGEKKRIPTGRGYQLKAERDGKVFKNGAGYSSRQTSPPNGATTNTNGSNRDIEGATTTSSEFVTDPGSEIISESETLSLADASIKAADEAPQL